MGSGSNSGGGGDGATAAMASETKKMVQSMKEIVSNFSDTEIYAVLKDCNMDPDAAVQRLLSLDTFQEVKSKKERRKETKDTQDTRPRGNNTSSNHGVKGANERNLGRNAAVLTNTNDYGNAAYKRENGSISQTLYSSSSSASRTTGKTLNQHPSPQSDSFGADDGRHSTGTVDGMPSSVQQQPLVQSAWSGAATGLVSMADIVKMGRAHNQASPQSTDISHDVVASYPSDYCVKAHHISPPLQPDPGFPTPSLVPKRINEFNNNADQHIYYDEWASIEQQDTITASSALDVSTVHDADIYSNQSNLYGDGGNLSTNCLPHDVQVSNDGLTREDLRFDFTKTASAQNLVNRSGTTSHYDNSTTRDMSSQNVAGHAYERLEVSSAAEGLACLSSGKEDHLKPRTRKKCTVVLPFNFQALADECSHLRFGTYNSGNGTAFSGPPTLDLQKTNTEEVSTPMDCPSNGGLDTRYYGYDANGPMESYRGHKETADSGMYVLPVSTQSEPMKDTISEATYGCEYTSTLSVPDSSFENIPQSSALAFSEADQTIRNQPSLPNEVRGYSNPRQTDLLASTVESVRGSDYFQGASFASQPLSSRYSGAVSSIGSPTISMAEVAKSDTFLAQQSIPTLPGAMGLGLQQHLAAHAYPQSSLNVEQLANLIGYSSALPQSQYKTYAQESYQGDASYQSLADMKYVSEHYRNDTSLSNLLLNNANASGYASAGNPSNIPGSFLHSPSVAPSATNANSYDAFLSQYKEANHFNQTLRPNDSSVWDYAAGSRTMSSVPSNTHYNLQAHNQHHLGYGQNQHALQHYSALGYLDSYHSQTGMPQEYQRQSLDDPTLYSQIQSSKQQQLWQQRY